MEAIVLLPGEGERIAVGAGATVVKATAETTGGAFSLAEATLPPGMAGPPPHAHRRTTDTFYILAGTLRLTLGGRTVDAPAGSYILVSPGVAHTFANASDDAPVRFLNLNAPGGWEHYLRDLAAAAHTGAIPGGAAFARIVARHDFVLPGEED